MLGCEMWFGLYFIGAGNIVCCVTGEIWAESVQEEGAEEIEMTGDRRKLNN